MNLRLFFRRSRTNDGKLRSGDELETEGFRIYIEGDTMKRHRKLFVVLLSLAMVFTTLPSTAFFAYAENGPEGYSASEQAVQEPGDGLLEQEADQNDETLTSADESAQDPAVGDAAASENDVTPGDNADKPEVVVEGTDTAETDKPISEEVTEEEVLPETGANYTVKGEAEAFIAHGKAAESEEAAVEALLDEGLDKGEAKRLARELFESKEAANDLTKDGEGDKQNGVSADGTSIDGVGVEWRVNDELYPESLLTVTPQNDGEQLVKARVWFELSGESNYLPGSIRITIPAYIFHKRGNGDPYGIMVIPYPEDPSKKDEFNYTLTKNEKGEEVYVLTNTRTFQSASQAFFEVVFAKLTPHDLIDMQESDPFYALIEVTTKNENTISLESEPITARFDTSTKVQKVTKRAYGKPEIVSAAAIPDNLRIPGEDKYVLVEWYVTVLNKANTWYYLDYKDWIPNEYRGFVLSAKPADPQTATVQDVYHGYQTNKLLTFIVKTAYPFSEFEPDVDYTFHNNIEFTNRQEDPTTDQPTTAQATAETTWHYTDPVHLEPDGHYMIFKNGNDDTDENNQTHKIIDKERITNDLHMWDRNLEGWFGSYPSALNEMQDAYLDKGEDGQIRLSYTMDSVGYTMPWMFEDESVKGPDGNRAAWNIANYTRPVTMVTTDYGLRIDRKGDALKVHDEFEYLSVEFPDIPYVYRGKPNRINEDGTWYAQNYRDGTFLYSPDNDKANWPDIDLELLIDGSWQKYATVSWKSGHFVAALTDGSTQTDKIIDFSALADKVDSVRTVLTMHNTATEGTITQAGISYDIRLVTALKTTDSIMDSIEKAFEKSNAPQFYIWNRSNLTAFYADGAREYDDDPIVSLGTEEYNYDDMIQNKDGYDVLSGYKTDLQIFPTKESSFDITEYDQESKNMIIHYKASVEERSFIHSKKTYKEAIADGRIIEETAGVWRDLLPAGMVPVLKDKDGNSAIKVRDRDLITNVNVEPNYMGSGRTLLEVYVDLQNVPAAIQVSGSNLPYYGDVLTLEFDALLSLDEAHYNHYFDEGNEPHNVVSFESSNEVIGTIDGYCGEPDKPVGNNVATAGAFKTETEKDLMTNLDPDRDTPSFVYAGESTELVMLATGNAGLHKDVNVNQENFWSQGTYYGDPSNARDVFVGGDYAYRLKYSPADDTSAEKIRFYDSLENYYAVKGNDDIDIKAPRWQGTFNGIDTTQIKSMGVTPIIYYSTVEGLELFIPDPDPTKPGTPVHRDFSELDEDGNPIWVEASKFTGNLSEVKAVAIDCTWKDAERTQKFRLNDGETLIAYIKMIAPSLDEANEEGYFADDAHAYNSACEMTDLIDDITQLVDEDFSVTSTYTKVGIQPYEISVRKVWDDDDDRDGYRQDQVTITLVANGTPTNRKLILNEKNEWMGTFEDLTYADPEGNKIKYTIIEDPVPENYKVGIAVTDLSKVDYVVTNKHIPETINLDGVKEWVGDDVTTRPEYITVRLYKSVYPYETETVHKVITVKPTPKGFWAYSFNNLYKNENGKEIKYRIEEVPGGAIDSYDPEYRGNDIINTYHPYGDLTVEKEIVNATTAASKKTFTFNFYFTDPEDGLPVMAQYDYDIIDLKTGDVVSSGKVEYGSQVTINADQKIHVHDIDEYVDYEVTEEDTPGFTMTKHTGDKGVIKPNKTAEAKFTNAYASEGRLELKARKALKNHELKKYQFHYEVYRVEADGTETLIRTTSSLDQDQVSYDPDGTVVSSGAPISFGVIRFTDAVDGQTFEYIIREQIPEDADDNFKYKGYIYDPTEYKIIVRMDDDGEGHMVPTYFDEKGHEIDPPETALFNEDFIFTNTYEVEGKIQLRVWKELKGRKIEPKEFSFELLDSEGNPMLDEDGDPIIAYNDENGVVVFPEIKYDHKDIGKTYYYGFREIPGNDLAVVYDDSVYGYRVAVSDNNDGTLSIDMDKAVPTITRDEDGNIESIDWTNWTTEGAGLPVFVNPVRPGNLAVTKLISDDSEEYNPDQMFHFHVKLIGEDIPEGELDYEITKVGQDDPAPGQDDPGDDGSGDNDDRSAAPSEGNGEGASYHASNNGNIILGLLGKLFRAVTDTAYAADDDIAGGTYDGVDWRITADGALIIGKEGETQTYAVNNGRLQAEWPWNDYRAQIKSFSLAGPVVARGRLTSMFNGNSSMTSADFTGFDTTAVTGYGSMFKNCSRLKSLDLSGWNTSGVTAGMNDMFNGCSSLKTLDVSAFDTSRCTNMSCMFTGCSALESLDVSNFNTANVTNMQQMFASTGMNTIDLSNFNVSKVTNMYRMFYGCKATTIDTTSWAPTSVTTMAQMFRYPANLTEVIGISDWNTPKLTNLELTFHGANDITSMDLSGWDVSKVTNMWGTFAEMSSLAHLNVSTWKPVSCTSMMLLFQKCAFETLDVSGWETPNLVNALGVFQNCTNLKTIDLSNWDTRKATDLSEFFLRDNQLCEVTFGPNVTMKGNNITAAHYQLSLPVPQTDFMTWIRVDEMYGPWTVTEVRENYDPDTMNGTWIWYNPVNYTINFTADEDVQGSMASVTPPAKEDYVLPANKFFKHNAYFDHWDEVSVETRDGVVYENCDTIPAGTYIAGSKVTLKAVFVDRESTVNVVDGEFDLYLHGGEMATFSDLPAGTAYEVWEETPDGWVLIKVVDASGIIQPLETSNAVFTNKYQPDIATVQFLGTKLMDNTAAEKDEFQFVMTEKGNTDGTITIINENGEEEEATLPITVSTLDGGLIQFPVIVYTKEDVGTHTYTIVEVDPEDENIDWDTHKETVTVLVNEYEGGTLSAKKNYDADGIRFINKTSPGTLMITKEGGPVTKDNQDDEFTVRITLHNENGQPIGDDEGIYWYKVDENGDIIDDGTQPNNPRRKSSSWDNFKAWASDTWEDIKGVFTEPLVETAYGAENDERSMEGEGYAVLTDAGDMIFFRSTETYENGTTGTFTDIANNSYTGKVYAGVETAGNDTMAYYYGVVWESDRSKIKTVRIADGQGIKPKTCRAWFNNCGNLISCDLAGLDTSNVRRMDLMFSYCSKLETINVSSLNTANVTTMQSMFYGCNKLTSLDVTNFNTEKVTTMYAMFYNCDKLTSLDVTNFNTERVTNMQAMFGYCSSLTDLDVTNFDTSRVTNMQSMFYNCSGLTNLDVTNFDTAKVTTMQSMFGGCSGLTSLDVTNFDTAQVASMSGMFNGCSGLTSLDVTNFETANVTGMSNMFNGCSGLTSLDVTNFDTSIVTSMAYMFNNCTSLTELDVSKFDTGKVTNMTAMFRYCSSLTELDVTNFNTSNVTLMGDEVGSGTNWRNREMGMFANCTSLTKIDVSSFDTSKVTRMNGMFMYCTSLKSLVLNNFDTSKVRDMRCMFNGCSNMEYLDVSSFDTRELPSGGMDHAFSIIHLRKVELGENLVFVKGPNYGPYFPRPAGDSTWWRNNNFGETYYSYWMREDGTFREKHNSSGGSYGTWNFEAMYNTNPQAMAGTWVWEVKDNRGIVHFDGNRGFTSQEDIIATSATQPITMPTADTTEFPDHTLIGWNTDPYGLGTQYELGETYTDVVKLGDYVTLYAQWEGENEVTCLVRHYKQNTDLATYSLAETTAVYGKPGDSVTPDTKNYQGFIIPEKQTVVLGSRAANMEVSYYYDRITYEIVYDGNGATSGTMEPVTMLWGVADPVRRCGYSKEGSLFTEWNTEPDGSGTSYNVGQSIVNIPGFETGEVTLYAQWFDIPYDPVTPTDGAITLTFKVGETIVLPDLPAGTTYTIEELTGPDYMPKGWTQEGIVGEDGTIESNITNEATVTNNYTAEGQAILKATKIFEGGELSEGQFTFELWRVMKGLRPQLIQSKTNNAPDDTGYTAEVVFDPINYTAKDAGETYTYYIKEVPAVGDNTSYDYHYDYVTVTVTDVGGVLDVKVEYDDDGAVFVNYPAGGHLQITKAVMPGSPEKVDFEFLIELFDKDGNELEGDFPLYTEFYKIPVESGDTITLSAGQTVRLGNLPPGTIYKVTELDKAGWTLIDSENAEGTIVSGETAEAVFRNEFMTEIGINLEADKTLIGKDLTEGEFEFGVYDDDETLVAFGKNDAEGHIVFSPIYYTSYDAGKTFFYKVVEEDGLERGISYDETAYDITVKVTEDEEGILSAEVSDNAEKMTFTNTYMSTGKITFSGTKTLEGREMKDGDVFTFEVKENGTDNVWTVTNNASGKIAYPTIGYTYDPVNKIDDTGTHTYTVTETTQNGMGITVDKNTYEVTVKVTEEGSGKLKVEPSDNYKALDFVNTYTAKGDITFEGTKVLTGREMTDKDTFEFRIEENGTANTWNFKNSADGKINYPTIAFTLDDLGDHTYTVKETSKDADGITVDKTVYTVNVSVTDNGDGTLKVESKDNFRALNFVNTYNADDEITFVGSKSIDTRSLEEGEKFDFTLYDGDGNEIETVQNNGSAFTFSPIKYTVKDAGKEFHYTVKETSEPGNGVSIDDTVYNITVKVTDNGDGTLTVESSTKEGVDTNHLAFVNPYEAKGEITFEGTKTLEGRDLTEDDVFEFQVSEIGTENSWTATNDETGKIDYPTIEYTLDDVGEHEYLVEEISEDSDDITVDDNTYTVTVTVEDNKDGTLKVEAADNYNALDFINTYEPPEEPPIEPPVKPDEPDDKPDKPKTGDTTDIMPYAFLGTSSLLLLILLLRRRKNTKA